MLWAIGGGLPRECDSISYLQPPPETGVLAAALAIASLICVSSILRRDNVHADGFSKVHFLPDNSKLPRSLCGNTRLDWGLQVSSCGYSRYGPKVRANKDLDSLDRGD
jgi:hypothetical protein